MSSDFRYQKFSRCKWRGCKVTIAIMPGDYCITHWYKANGKTCPPLDQTTPKHPSTRPAIDRNVAPSHKGETSRGAAARVLPSTGTKRRTVYDTIMANMSNGMTCDEVCEATGMLVQSCTSAIHTLAQDGWLTDSGERRPTRTGTLAVVWTAL